jgi:two-component system cell cycle response regulator
MNILIADDDRTTAHLLSTRLSQAGHHTSVAFDTMQAMMLCMRLKPDVVLLDVQMPGGSGLQVLHRLKASTKTATIPVIVLTASPENERLALEQGADAFLLKPPDFDRIDAILERCARALVPALVGSPPRPPQPQLVISHARSARASAASSERIVRNVLVIDDDRVVAHLIADRLQRSAFATIFATDVPDALHVLNAFRIDAVVLDMQLPSGTGLDVIQRLRTFSRHGDIPILVVSGSLDEDGARFALAAGADHYFPKPPDLDALLAKLLEYYQPPVLSEEDAGLSRFKPVLAHAR